LLIVIRDSGAGAESREIMQSAVAEPATPVGTLDEQLITRLL